MPRLNGMSTNIVKALKCHKKIKGPEDLENSPFCLFDDEVAEKGTVLIQNRSPLDVVLPAGLPLAESDVDLSVYQVSSPEQKEYELNLTEGGEAVISTTELENSLEPGMSPPNYIDKKAELDFIRNHPTIPEEYKSEFISFLEERAELFSGEEFSKKHFPRDVYEHDVELIEDIPQLSSRPFPVSGIRLSQLKDDINELCKNGVLSPGDSPYTSPMFYVLKKQVMEKLLQKAGCVLITEK